MHATNEQMPQDVGDLEELEKEMDEARAAMIEAACVQEDATDIWYDATDPVSIDMAPRHVGSVPVLT